MNNRTAFGEWVKRQRKALDMTQRDLAERAFCSHETVQKIEAGALRPSRQLADLLADGLAIPEAERPAFVALARALTSTNPLPASRPGSLPCEPTTFIGREGEVAAVQDLLRRPDVRLLTLTGPPGIGKTRLAQRVAREMAGDFEGGVYFVALATVRDPGLVLSTVARAVGVREVGQQPLGHLVSEYLRDRRALLLLDNFEQVVPAAADVAALLASTPGLKALVTSREVLHVYGDHNIRVPSMRLPASGNDLALDRLSQFEAVQLFVERAHAARSDFALTAENAASVVEVCRRLDGLPLAIELATTRIRVLTPQLMLARLGNGLALLAGGGQNLPARQQTLRGAIDWSYDLLEEDERSLFRRLSVFAGGWTLEAAESVAGVAEVLGVLSLLVEKSLVRQEVEGGESRFSMMETIREYAAERLEESGEARDVRLRQACFYMQLAETAEPELSGSEETAWLDRLESEHDNVRSALQWLVEAGVGNPESGEYGSVAARLAGALWRFWFVRAHFSEGQKWLRDILSSFGDLPMAARGKLLHGVAVLAWGQGDYSASGRAAEASMSILRTVGDKQGAAGALNVMGAVALQQGDNARAGDLFADCLTLCRELGDRQGEALALSNLGLVALNEGAYSRAELLLSQSLAIRRELDYSYGIAQSLNDLGVVMRRMGDLSRSRNLHRESLALFKELGHRDGEALALFRLGLAAFRGNDLQEASAFLVESLALYRELGIRQGVAGCLEGIAAIDARRGELRRAGLLWGAAEGLRTATATPVPSPDLAEYGQWLAQGQQIMGATEFARTLSEGRALDWRDAVALVRSPSEFIGRLGLTKSVQADVDAEF